MELVQEYLADRDGFWKVPTGWYFLAPKLEYYGSDWLEVQTTSLGSDVLYEFTMEPSEWSSYINKENANG